MRTRYVGRCVCTSAEETIEVTLEHGSSIPPVNLWIGCSNREGHKDRSVYDVRLSAAGEPEVDVVARLNAAMVDEELRRWAERHPEDVELGRVMRQELELVRREILSRFEEELAGT